MEGGRDEGGRGVREGWMREGGEGGRDEGKMEGGMERRGGGMDGWTMTVNKFLFLSKYPIPVNNNSNIRSRMSSSLL